MAAIRVGELTRLLEQRYGAQLPDDDAGREDARIMVMHLAHMSGPDERIMGWLATKCPWMPVARARTMAKQAIADPRRWTADELAAQLRLTAETREQLRITTIGAVDLLQPARAARRHQRARQRSKIAKLRRRRAKGAKRRVDYEAGAASHAKPWLAAGVSRATWYRRRETSAAP